MDKENNKTRNSSIELLRILAMLMIIGSHYFYHGGFNLDSISFVPNKYIMEFSYLGRLGVCIFVIITGYFMVESHINPKKIILLYLQVWLYSVVIYTLMVLSGQYSFSIKSFLQALLPVSFHQYWFFTAYIVLYLLIPFINSALNSLPSRQRIASIVVMFVMWSVIPTFILTGDLYGSEIPTFILLYCLGAGLRKGDFKMLENKMGGYAITIMCSINGCLYDSSAFCYAEDGSA